MAYTAPRTFVAGELETAAIFNTFLRDNDLWVLTDSPACRAFNSTTAALAINTLSAILLDSERFDNASVHSTVTNTTRMTIPTGGGGKYVIGGTVTWGLNATGYRQVRFRQNGTTYLAIDTRVDASGATGVESAPMTVYSLAAADYVELVCQQSAGAGLSVGGNPGAGPEFYCFWFRT